jgi:hypothetical protein
VGEVDAVVDDDVDDGGGAGRDVPGFGDVHVKADQAAGLAGVVQGPLLAEERVVGDGVVVAGEDHVGLGEERLVAGGEVVGGLEHNEAVARLSGHAIDIGHQVAVAELGAAGSFGGDEIVVINRGLAGREADDEVLRGEEGAAEVVEEDGRGEVHAGLCGEGGDELLDARGVGDAEAGDKAPALERVGLGLCDDARRGERRGDDGGIVGLNGDARSVEREGFDLFVVGVVVTGLAGLIGENG